MAAQPSRWQTFAVSRPPLAFPERRTVPGHQTSEMIQEDMKIIEPRRAQRSRREESEEGEQDRRG